MILWALKKDKTKEKTLNKTNKKNSLKGCNNNPSVQYFYDRFYKITLKEYSL